MRRGDCSEDEPATLERALARLIASLGRIGAEADVAFSSDELILRAERAKRNRETILGTAHVRRGTASPSTEP